MIGAINATTPHYFTPASAKTDEKITAPARADDSVTLSQTSQTTSGLLSNLSGLSLDPNWHMANAKSDLQALMTKLGIPASTKVDIQSNNDGTFVVTSDDPKAAEIERMLNDGSARALRNDLIGMENALKIQQIAHAVTKAQQQADANPAMTDAIYARLPAIAAQITAQSFSLSFANQKLDYTLA
ncbi:hypothetical protein [Mariprofundus ferrooxydans]|nr:hypothetical protein [Mariprofundus ferrooxydans]KON47591.1 hypothetical protein AL013_07600 [Mariprofundus ferrooxydans]